jgi:hypothetical protein
MSSYQPLADHLASRKGDQWDATFEEIERALGRPLPRSAYRHNAWWANQVGPGHSQTHGWRSVGWRTSRLNLEQRRVRFEREKRPRDESSNRRAELISQAMKMTGIGDPDAVVEKALQSLIAREAARHLMAMGGKAPDFEAPPRRRPAA